MGLYYTDVGYPQECLDNEGSYQQIVLTLRNVPVRIPVSACLPKACNSSKILQPLLDSSVDYVNEHVMAGQDFGNMWQSLESPLARDYLFKYSGEQNLPLLR